MLNPTHSFAVLIMLVVIGSLTERSLIYAPHLKESMIGLEIIFSRDQKAGLNYAKIFYSAVAAQRTKQDAASLLISLSVP